MDDEAFEVYWRTLRVAMDGATINYSALAAQVGLPTEWPQLGAVLGPILDRINAYERALGRPLLSAVVVRSDTGLPGASFFTMARRAGEMLEGEDEQTFWRKEIARVRKTWVHT